ncbi:MAG: hypothetical protein WC729_29355 [Sphingomonas sp.]|jgi:hypothetical protein|uniref:hypothetical protein n=1 Tax=Sphingomonas sp. TaxID=28214 RepID=UPI003565C381
MFIKDRKFRGFGAVSGKEINQWIKMGLDVIETGIDIGLKVDAASKGQGQSKPPPQQQQTQQPSQPQTPAGQNVQGLGSSIDTNTMLMVGGGLAGVGLLAFLFTRKR